MVDEKHIFCCEYPMCVYLQQLGGETGCSKHHKPGRREFVVNSSVTLEVSLSGGG